MLVTGNQFFKFKVFILWPLGLCCLGQTHHSPHPSYAPEYMEVIFCWGPDGIDTQIVVYYFTYTVLLYYC